MRVLSFLNLPPDYRWAESVIVIAVAILAAVLAHLVVIRFVRLATRAK